MQISLFLSKVSEKLVYVKKKCNFAAAKVKLQNLIIMLEEMFVIVLFGIIIAICSLIYHYIKKAHYKKNQIGEPETKVFGETSVTIYKLTDLDYGEKVVVARVVSETQLSKEQMLEIGRFIADAVEVRFYKETQYNIKYAYYRRDKDIVYFDD